MNTALLRAEARRALRNRRTLILAAVLPVVFFTTFSSGGSGTVGGLAVAPYIMVSMATYGAMNALFTGGGLIAAERAIGWNRQLRVAGLRGRDYLATKVSMAYVTAVPGLLLVFVVGALGKHVRLGAAQWVEAALSVLLGLVPVAASASRSGTRPGRNHYSRCSASARRCSPCWAGCGCRWRRSPVPCGTS